MSLYEQWTQRAEAVQASPDAQKFWLTYFGKEQKVYEQILAGIDEPIKGTLHELAERFDMDDVTFTGFIYGINTSLKAGEYDVETLDENSEISLEVDPRALYYNMHDAKADWLYGLEQWDGILSEDERKAIAKEQRVSGIFVAEQTVGRNDPCPCGSGKKYKKCCGA